MDSKVIEWFDELYLKNAQNMAHLAARFFSDTEIAEELVQEAFIILLYKYDTVCDHPNLDGWLFQTLKNLVMNECQSARHRLECSLLDSYKDKTDDIYCSLLSESLPPDLSEDERKLLIWYYEVQLSYEEIAKRFGVSVLACRTRMFRARQKCKKLLLNDYDL